MTDDAAADHAGAAEPTGAGEPQSITPMFPLGSVLLPGMALPLQVFEPRYRVMMHDLRGEPSPAFGVVLIERGSEVGGGETRTDVGCRAVVARAEEHPDGTWTVVAVGTERIRVDTWLTDDPYPRARVSDWPDEDDPAQLDVARLDEVERSARRVAALAVELGARGQLPDFELSPDPSLRTYQLATVSPLGALDRRRVLTTPRLDQRIELLGELLGEQALLLQARLSFEE